ncbi:hypothetical protein [Aquirufa sp.]|jgi:hypothetical protein|uniref:hypothetical protein n=1 Tax=Aquirufa sp. TaxID=2676249 RepID=UPI0037BF4E42
MKLKNLLPIVAIALVASACDYQKYNRIKQKDVHAGNEYVYGVHPDSAAVQSKNTYTAKPELEVRANAIREKLFQGKEISKGN